MSVAALPQGSSGRLPLSCLLSSPSPCVADFGAVQASLSRTPQQVAAPSEFLAAKARSPPAPSATSLPPKKRPRTSAENVAPSSTTEPSSTGCVASTPATPITSSLTPDMTPEKYLCDILHSRGYGAQTRPALPKITPTAKQVGDYDTNIGEAVRKGDIEKLKRMVAEHRQMDACNKFGESVVHLGCRRSNLEVVKYLLEHGGTLLCRDDLGRMPLHDVCWVSNPSFDIVRLCLDENSFSLITADDRGWTPLRYIKTALYEQWVQFLDSVKDTYWPVKA